MSAVASQTRWGVGREWSSLKDVAEVALDVSKWTGEGAFTKQLVDALRAFAGLVGIRVEDSPSSRSDPTFLFVSNEVFLMVPAGRAARLAGAGRGGGTGETLHSVADLLASLDHIGPPDYEDEGMLQYLRTERIVPPYQTRGYKLVEMVRVYVVPSSVSQEGRA